MIRRRALAVVALATVQAGCLVQVTKVKDAAPLFRAARLEAAREGDRSGPARELNALVYDPADGELVRVRVPLWLVAKAEGHGHWDDVDLGSDDVASRVRHRLRGRAVLRELARGGRGTVVEVEEEDGEQVLVWLQ